ncbi:MAG: S-methyl-5'-thioadenosine phosphorylase [Chloroflexota bacterium]
MEPIALAIIGGSGLYDFPGLLDKRENAMDTPFGKPSAPVITGILEGKRVAFLARHGLGHQLSPSEVNYRANIFALKLLGVRNIVSVNACGSLREDIAPGDLVIPDQLFDNTRCRERTFFGDGIVAHVSVAEPFCKRLGFQLIDTIKKTSSKKVHIGGTFIIIEGPRFSTKAESNVFRSWGMSIIGMTASPEAFLAREAEICYSAMAHVTDYDVWHTSESPVTVEMVIKVLLENTSMAQKVIRQLISVINPDPECTCTSALDSTLITNKDYIPAETHKKLDILIGKYLQKP